MEELASASSLSSLTVLPQSVTEIAELIVRALFTGEARVYVDEQTLTSLRHVLEDYGIGFERVEQVGWEGPYIVITKHGIYFEARLFRNGKPVPGVARVNIHRFEKYLKQALTRLAGGPPRNRIYYVLVRKSSERDTG